MTEPAAGQKDDSAWTRLREGKVAQWGLAYAAGAWALLQVIGFAADAFSWPDVTNQFSMLVLAFGFPVVLTLAWYHGDRGEQHVTRAGLAVLTVLTLAWVTCRSVNIPMRSPRSGNRSNWNPKRCLRTSTWARR